MNQIETSISLRSATDNDKNLYRNLLNIYQNDLAPFTDEFKEVDEDGYFDRDTVNDIFIDNESVMPFVVQNKNKAVGILIFTKPPYAKKGCDYCIQEFFIINGLRGTGAAEEACRQLIEKYPGKYCILVLNKNTRAIKYWNKFIDKYATKLSEYKYDEQGFIIEFQTN